MTLVFSLVWGFCVSLFLISFFVFLFVSLSHCLRYYIYTYDVTYLYLSDLFLPHSLSSNLAPLPSFHPCSCHMIMTHIFNAVRLLEICHRASIIFLFFACRAHAYLTYVFLLCIIARTSMAMRHVYNWHRASRANTMAIELRVIMAGGRNAQWHITDKFMRQHGFRWRARFTLGALDYTCNSETIKSVSVIFWKLIRKPLNSVSVIYRV